MSTYTDSLGLEEITPGDQAGLWGNTTNNNLALIDQAVTGVTPISFTGLSGNVKTLDAANGALDEARAAVLNITGNATGSNTVVVPNKQKTYLVRNETGQIVNFRTASPGEVFPVPVGNSTLVFCDGNNNVFPGIVTASVGPVQTTGGGTGLTSYTAGDITYYASGTALTKLPIGAANRFLTSSGTAPQWTQTLGVANGGTGAGTFTAGSLIVGNGTGNFGTLTGGANGQVATWNGSTWTAATPTAGSLSAVAGSSTITANTVAGTATISQTSGQAIAALGFTPYNSTNPSQFITSSSLAAYAALSGATFSGSVKAPFLVNTNETAGILADGSVRTGNGSSTIFTLGAATQIAVNGTFNFFFNQNGQASKPGGGSWADSSDVRLKDNVVPLVGALDKLLALNPVSYTWKYDRPNIPNVGFIAQEVQQIIPSAVSISEPTKEQKPFIDDDKILDVGWKNDMTAYLVKAIQELNAKVNAQATQITALEEQVINLGTQ
jgi:hypothetical protein